MTTSNKYNYRSFSIRTAIYSLKLTWKVARYDKGALFLLIFLCLLPIPFSFGIGSLVLIYAYCESGAIPESFKESWGQLKRNCFRVCLAMISFIVIIMALTALLAFFIPSEPYPVELAPPESGGGGNGWVFVFALLSFLVGAYTFALKNILFHFINNSGLSEVYNRYRGYGAREKAVENDTGMNGFFWCISLILITILFFLIPIFPKLYFLLNLLILVVHAIVICHVYTPDMPKAKEQNWIGNTQVPIT
jgi:magnesium-transporting ATPase (P-type)